MENDLSFCMRWERTGTCRTWVGVLALKKIIGKRKVIAIIEEDGTYTLYTERHEWKGNTSDCMPEERYLNV